MDRLEIRIVESTVAANPGKHSGELVVNGRPLAELVAESRVRDRKVRPKRPPHLMLAPLRAEDVLPPSTRLVTQSANAILLRCACGDDGCAYVTARIDLDAERVQWRDFVLGNGGAPSRTLRSLGPFVFDRAQYESALRSAR